MKKLILMVGIPGSGKSTQARFIQEEEGGVILSTDDLFQSGEHYLWSAHLISMAHMLNQGKCREAMSRSISPIIIDNTNVRKNDRAHYITLAEEFGYTVELVEPDTIWKNNVYECFDKCKHNVPLGTIAKMLESLKNED